MVIVIVLAFHSVLAYLASVPTDGYRFDTPPYRWQAIPIVDSERWFGFDVFCAWQDVSLMSLMFFLSGLFVPASLARKGTRAYIADRVLRIGLPFALAVLVLMPVAYYPVYRVSAIDPSLVSYWQQWRALPFWPCGPQWFLWQLLVLNVLAAGWYALSPRRPALSRLSAAACRHPVRFFVVLVSASALAYVPLAVAYTPWAWANYGPFSLQLSRPLHYLIYFFAGFALGSYSIDRGLLAAHGALARAWRGWLAVAVAGFVLWALPTSVLIKELGEAPTMVRIAAALGFVLACAGGCFFLLSVCLRFFAERMRMLESLSANAYGMYLVHYVFVVWMQFAMLDVSLVAVGKAAMVFGVTLAMSWGMAAAFGGAVLTNRLARAK